MLKHSEEFSCDNIRIRMDVFGQEKIDSILPAMNFLNYRLAGVEKHLELELGDPDIIWEQDHKTKSIDYTDEQVMLKGEWHTGEIEKIIVSYLAKKLIENGRYPFHASAVHYKGKNIMFLGGEDNSGKTMSQIEACKRGAKIISTETVITNKDGSVIAGSKSVFLRNRAKGTERVDKPDQDEGVDKFFNKRPEFEIYDQECSIDMVVLPDIDGNFSPQFAEMAQFEKEYQTFHCICDYLGMHLLLASGLPMPLFDSEKLRKNRVDFIKDFSQRNYYFIRGKDPQIIMDKIDEKVL